MSPSDLESRERIGTVVTVVLFFLTMFFASVSDKPYTAPLLFVGMIMAFIDVCLTRYWHFRASYNK